MISISVVILTYKRVQMLRRCLDSLIVRQSKLPDEIVIVNAADDNLDFLLTEYIKSSVVIKIKKSENLSLAYNRNVGVMASTGDLIAFTDDDCEVCYDWVEKFLGIFKLESDIGSVGGISIDATKDILTNTVERVAMLNEDYNNKLLTPRCYYFCTRNVCFKKKILEQVGMFEGTYRRSYEDTVTGVKIFNAGHKNIYCPEITVKHYGRGNIAEASKRFFEYGRDICAGAIQFQWMPKAYSYKTQIPVFCVVMGVFLGVMKDLVRYSSVINPFLLFICSLIMKGSVTAGIIYERSNHGKNNKKN